MIETLPEYIIITPVHQKTLLKNLLDRLKRVNRLIYDCIVQSSSPTVDDFYKCSIEQKTLTGSTNSQSHNPASTKKQMSTSPYRTAVTGYSRQKCATVARSTLTIKNIIIGVIVNDVHTLSSTMRNM